MFTIIIFLIALLSGIGSFVSSTGKTVIKHRDESRTLTKDGYIFLTCTIVLVLLPPIQNYLQEKHNDKVEKEQKVQQDQRDSSLKARYDSTIYVMKDKFDTSNQKSTSIISETLGKYGYKLDSANKTLIRVMRDSSKTKIIVADDPVLSMPNEPPDVKGINIIREEKEKTHYSICFKSYDAGSSRFSINCSIIVFDSLIGYKYLGKDNFLTKENTIAKDARFCTTFNIGGGLKYSYVYFWTRGSYFNLDGSKQYFTDEVYYNHRDGNVFGTISGQTRNNIIQTVKKYEK